METAIRTTKTWDGLNCEMVVAGKIAELQLQKCCPQCGKIAIADYGNSAACPCTRGDITDNGPVFGMDQRF